jgi:phospholipid/cholesterol/gamma-HCH transport system permease protein
MIAFGRYLILMTSLFTKRERFGVYVKLTIDECFSIGIQSILIVAIVSTFIGAVTAIQTAYNLLSPLIPNYIISMIVRDMTIQELSPTILCIVLAGKVGSSIAGQLGTMRITDQIDALEVMGINSASYLILPKIIASVLTIPMMVVISALLSMVGGYFAATYTGVMTATEYHIGLQYDFNHFTVPFAMIKALVFAFLISSISSFHGYYTKGGALEVGKSSTTAFTYSCIGILIADFGLAKLLL